GGLPWAPEQWQEERAWLTKVRRDTRDELAGWSLKSRNWEVFTDVSAEFAGEAALVLESAWKQAPAGLGFDAGGGVRVGARIYRRRADYEAVTHDHSGGH